METTGDYIAAVVRLAVYSLLGALLIVALGRFTGEPEEISNRPYRLIARSVQSLGGGLERVFWWFLWPLASLRRHLLAALTISLMRAINWFRNDGSQLNRRAATSLRRYAKLAGLWLSNYLSLTFLARIIDRFITFLENVIHILLDQGGDMRVRFSRTLVRLSRPFHLAYGIAASSLSRVVNYGRTTGRLLLAPLITLSQILKLGLHFIISLLLSGMARFLRPAVKTVRRTYGMAVAFARKAARFLTMLEESLIGTTRHLGRQIERVSKGLVVFIKVVVKHLFRPLSSVALQTGLFFDILGKAIRRIGSGLFSVYQIVLKTLRIFGSYVASAGSALFLPVLTLVRFLSWVFRAASKTTYQALIVITTAQNRLFRLFWRLNVWVTNQLTASITTIARRLIHLLNALARLSALVLEMLKNTINRIGRGLAPVNQIVVLTLNKLESYVETGGGYIKIPLFAFGRLMRQLYWVALNNIIESVIIIRVGVSRIGRFIWGLIARGTISLTVSIKILAEWLSDRRKGLGRMLRFAFRPIGRTLERLDGIVQGVEVSLPIRLPLKRVLAIAGLVLVIATGQRAIFEFTHVEIYVWTNDTTAEWMKEVSQGFNAARQKTDSGKIIRVEVEQMSSGDVLPKIQAGEIQPTLWIPGQSSWINEANSQWQREFGRPLIQGSCPEVVFTANGLGMYRPMAEAMGWPEKGIGWKEITALASDPAGWGRYGHPEWGQFKFGHTHPASSNSGLLAMTALVYSKFGIDEGLTPDMVKSNEVFEAFHLLELNTYRYGMSTSGLMVKMAERGPYYLQAVASSESTVLATNHDQEEFLRFPLVFVFPENGTFWSNNPACVLDAKWVSKGEREAAEIYIDYLLGREAQEMAVEKWLRPIDPKYIPTNPPALWELTDLSNLPQAGSSLSSVSGDTKAAVVEVFKATKKPATVIVVVDTSASMGGSKLRKALEGMASFLKLLSLDDEIIAYRFDNDVKQLPPSGTVAEVSDQLNIVLDGLKAHGKTSLYDAVCIAVDHLEEIRAADKQADRRRLYGIVVLSDGEDTASTISREEMLHCLPSGDEVEGVKIFTIAYGRDADEEVLMFIADQTNGKFYTSAPEDIEEALLAISFEQ